MFCYSEWSPECLVDLGRGPFGGASTGLNCALHGAVAHPADVIGIANTEADQITAQLAIRDWHDTSA